MALLENLSPEQQDLLIRFPGEVVELIQTTIANSLNTDNQPSPVTYSFVDDGDNSLTVSRRGRTTIVMTDTARGLAATGTIDTITCPNATDGDIFIFMQVSAARQIIWDFANATNLTPLFTSSTLTMGGDNTYVAFIQREGQFIQMPGNALEVGAQNTIQLAGTDVLTIDSGGEIDSSGFTYLRVQSERSAETAATATIQFTGLPAGAFSLELLVDKNDGNGQFSIYYADFPALTAIATVIADITATVGTDFTATDDTVDTNTLTAPAGYGATANGWLFGYIGSGVTAAVTNFLGGVNGSDQDDDLDTINDILPGQLILLENIMAANTISLVSGGNFSLGGTVKVFGGETVILWVNSLGTQVTKFPCCKHELTATRWVDPSGSTNALRNINWPYPTITAAKTAASAGDTIKVLSGTAEYDEKNLLKHQVFYEFDNSAQVNYSGATDGSIFDDSASGANGAVSSRIFVKTPGELKNYSGSSAPAITNAGTGANAGIFYITNALSDIFSKGGQFVGTDFTAKVTNGRVEIQDALLFMGGASYCVEVTGGELVLINCKIFQSGAQIAINVTGGKLVLKDCLIQQVWNNAGGHGITCSGGEIQFLGTNRILTTNAGAQSINCTVATNARLIGGLYTTNAIGGAGVITDLITGVALVPTLTNAAVQ